MPAAPRRRASASGARQAEAGRRDRRAGTLRGCRQRGKQEAGGARHHPRGRHGRGPSPRPGAKGEGRRRSAPERRRRPLRIPTPPSLPPAESRPGPRTSPNSPKCRYVSGPTGGPAPAGACRSRVIVWLFLFSGRRSSSVSLAARPRRPARPSGRGPSRRLRFVLVLRSSLSFVLLVVVRLLVARCCASCLRFAFARLRFCFVLFFAPALGFPFLGGRRKKAIAA